jgi:hypothetical protein
VPTTPSFGNLVICAICATHSKKINIGTAFGRKSRSWRPAVSASLTKQPAHGTQREIEGTAVMQQMNEIIIQIMMGIFALAMAVFTLNVFY